MNLYQPNELLTKINLTYCQKIGQFAQLQDYSMAGRWGRVVNVLDCYAGCLLFKSSNPPLLKHAYGEQ